MKTLFLVSICSLFAFAQPQNNIPDASVLRTKLPQSIVFNDSIGVDQIKDIKQIPYIENCSDTIFWSLVQQKGNVLELIEKLTDETILKEVYVPNFGGEYTVADVALVILKEKIEGIPVLNLIGQEFISSCGYCSYWSFVREHKENRVQLQKNLKKWYLEHKNTLVWIASESALTGDCNSPAGGHYKISKE
ncbi:hypothetical protein I2486_07255 [Cellulophaga sp. E16_2]|uniref:hypothetical protein n=1 Tax=Cellulophaga sp. E16_2 TaxID=2789297 RepID=UPI001A934091|nr:hypothetical protein [Cellulophaga sp. E16_2]MBO0591203.1 hypothetical protein [Cellulophaga sp. E16_2]